MVARSGLGWVARSWPIEATPSVAPCWLWCPAVARTAGDPSLALGGFRLLAQPMPPPPPPMPGWDPAEVTQ